MHTRFSDNTDEQLEANVAAYRRLLQTIRILRAEGGCPWDREQTPLSMRRDLIEETFEAVDAITAEDALHAREELGDVLLNASMIAYMYQQRGDFSLAECFNELVEKLIRRHPHVFPQSEGQTAVEAPVQNADEVLTQWDRIKRQVEGRAHGSSILDEVPSGFPPLLRAYKLQKKAAKKGFDWQSIQPVYDKVVEELAEVKAASESCPDGQEAKPFTVASEPEQNEAQLHVEEEIGDLLFAVVNYARHLGVDPEYALNAANRKFYRRFSFVEQEMEKNGTPMDSNHLDDEDNLWNEAKRRGL